MRINDACLVVSNVDDADSFYSTNLGLRRRMRNVRFADFLLGDGLRLALWKDSSIAQTVGSVYPVGPGLPFELTLAVEVPVPDTLAPNAIGSNPVVDPDGFILRLCPAASGETGIRRIELAVSDRARTTRFLECLGLDAMTAPELVLNQSWFSEAAPELAAESDSTAQRSTGRLMLAIELATGADVDRVYSELLAKGLVASGPPAVYEWGSRSVYFVDHDGYIWEIYAWVETPR
jgi:catechol 2,3-dioxygenase-like lactoylglutathione lyase family enzyme